LKNVIILLIIFFLIRALRKSLVARRERKQRIAGQQANYQKREPSAKGESEEMVLDQVCGSYVPVSAAIVSESAGRRAYFCSEECRDKAGSPS